MKSAQLNDGQNADIKRIYIRERRLTTFCLLVIVFLTIQDFFEDLAQAQHWYEILPDIAYMSVIAFLLVYIWRHTPLASRKRNLMLTQEIVRHHADAEVWSQKAKELLAGLSTVIDEQMTLWALSKAEKQVALLILKGLSLKEIATLRGTSEKTVRQQATQVYSKAKVRNRAELSAFFLEDLLLPDMPDAR